MIRTFVHDPVLILIVLPAILLSLSFHEFAHAISAVKLGDNTPSITGRLSLNPFAHIDLIGFLCMMLTGFGWAKPVQINPRNFKNNKRDIALTAIAGPISNILLSFVCTFFVVLMMRFGIFPFLINVTHSLSGLPFWKILLTIISTIFYYMSIFNLNLAVFNLIPIPPLDGSRVLDSFLRGKVSYYYNAYGHYFQIGLFVVLVLIMNTNLFNPIAWLVEKIWMLFRRLFVLILF